MQKLQIPPPATHDEIDLVDLLHAIWKQKIVVAVTALLVMLAATAYAFLATPVYQVQSLLRPANLKDLDAVRIPDLYTLTPEDALKRLGVTLNSYEMRLRFFRDNPHLLEAIREPHLTLEQTFERFNADGFRVLRPDTRQGSGLSDFIGLQLTYPEGIDGVQVVNGFVRYAIELQKQAIAEDVTILIQNRLNELQRKIGAARAAYEARKDSEIAKLREAVAPLRPIKPRKALAIALGLVLGAMLGVFAALIRALYQQRQASGPTPPTAVSVPQATP